VTAFVILAAGRGSRLGRLGDELPKCLLPLDGRAVISHQFALAPRGARLVVVTGYRAEQVEEYVRLAHPDLDVTFVLDERWGSGPGASLLAARAVVGDDDLVFVACDTLWERNDALWTTDSESWVGVAPIPAGTPAARWCRVVPGSWNEGSVISTAAIHDKTPDVTPGSLCWTALARISAEDLEVFWQALTDADTIAGEVQLSSGLQAIVDRGEPLWIMHIDWLDVGDEQAYRAALAATTGYDPLKPDQVTYVLPTTGRVVKWHVNSEKVAWRAERAKLLGDVVPKPVDQVGRSMFAYEYVLGPTVYQCDTTTLASPLLEWWEENFWSTRTAWRERPHNWRELTMKFYRDKTFSRVMALDATLRSVALDAITRVDWEALVENCVPGTFHGDLTYANVVTWDDDWNTKFVGIDWREDFAGETTWGDLRYDLGKLLSGTVFHWENATHGDFRRWPSGAVHRDIIRLHASHLGVDVLDVERIAALCLLGSAALHAAPMDEILVTRGARWLGEVT
jgi:dTDP-glucose pyrophosphorylase